MLFCSVASTHSSECCSCQTQRGEDSFNRTTGLTYPHSLAQASCMQRCMNISYPKYSSATGSAVGIISGTSGVWTLFDYGGEVGVFTSLSYSTAPHPKIAVSHETNLIGQPPYHRLRYCAAWAMATSFFFLWPI